MKYFVPSLVSRNLLPLLKSKQSHVHAQIFIGELCRADLDPIYYCELLDACEVKDDGDAAILSLNVKPSAVPRG